MEPLTLVDKVFFLQKMEPFAKLNLDALLPIADKLLFTQFDSGEMVFGAGEPGHRMYLVVSGALQLVSGNSGQTTYLTVGDYFGDEALFGTEERGYSVTCTEATSLLSLSRTHLATVTSEFPAVALGFLQLYAHQLPDRSCYQRPSYGSGS